jgi:hypothetical protein
MKNELNLKIIVFNYYLISNIFNNFMFKLMIESKMYINYKIFVQN